MSTAELTSSGPAHLPSLDGPRLLALRDEVRRVRIAGEVEAYEVFRADDEELVLYCEHLQTVLYRDPEAARAGDQAALA